MLPASARLRSSRDFTLATRRGRRAGARTVVAYLDTPGDHEGPRVGFVVSRAVGPSVTRHRVVRRLRHVMRDRVRVLPCGSTLVVRALPAAADASSATLARDVDRCLERVAPA